MIDRNKQYEGMTITFNTTEDCNLACKYCYEVDKKPHHLSLDYAKKFIDIILDDPDPIGVMGTKDEWIIDNGLILDFIGGDALINPQLIREILYYFMWTANLKDHRWANRWKASISTNGTLFDRKDVRDFMEEFGSNLSVGVSIDGCKEIHDLYRVFPNGEGSLKEIEKQWSFYIDWCNKFHYKPVTKATLSKESIPYLSKSLKYLHEDLGLQHINMNFIMEETGIINDDLIILDSELEKCFKYVLEHKNDLYWSFFDNNMAIGLPMDEESKCENRCGGGAMPALSINGYIYPCFRYLPHTTKFEDKKINSIGNIWNGITSKDPLACARNATRWNISDKECRECEIESSCAYCIAGCFAEFSEYKRTKYICEVNKIQSKWAKLYWEKLEEQS